MTKSHYQISTEGEVAIMKLTVALHALVDEAIQERAAVVTEGGAPKGVDLKLVLRSGVLGNEKRRGSDSYSPVLSGHVYIFWSH